MTFGKLLFWLLSSRCLVEAGGAYIGVTDVGFVDSVDEFGFIGGTVSWTAPTDLSNVSSYRAWLSSDMDTELADFFKGTGIIIPAEFGWELLKPEATSFDFDRTQRKALFSDLTTRYLQVYTSFGPDRTWQDRSTLAPSSMLMIFDVGWTGTELPVLSQDVNFTDNDTRCGYLGGTITFDVDPSVDLSILQFWKVFFALDTSGANATTAWQLPMSFSASVTLPSDYMHDGRSVLFIGGVTGSHEVFLPVHFLDDCGGVPAMTFAASFSDEDPNEELIGGTVTVHLGHGQYDKFTVMRLYLAFDATGLGRTELASATPFEVQFSLPNGTRLDSRDYLLIYPENPYGQQAVPIALLVTDFILFWNSAPGSSSVVQSIEFNDEDPIFQQLSGTVRWVPGSITVTTHFVVYVAEDEQGTGKLQVSPDVPVDAAHEWHISVTLNKTYTHLLVYAANNQGISNFSSAVPLKDNKVTCLTDTFWPCARHQVLKTEAQHPSGCSGTSCTSEECCVDAGQCGDFFNGTQNVSEVNSSDVGPGCAQGYVAQAVPPEYCGGPVCFSSDCCLRHAEAPAAVAVAQATHEAAEVEWSVPELHNCMFADYEVQVADISNASNFSNLSWQAVVGCSDLTDSCGSRCEVAGLQSQSSLIFRVRTRCLLLGALPENQTFYTEWTESAPIVTGLSPPSAPENLLLSAHYETEVLYSWQPQELGPDCTFDSWLVQLRDNSLPTAAGHWTTRTECASTVAACNIRGLSCNTSYSIRIAATCKESGLVGDWSTETTFQTKPGDVCLNPATAPLNVTISGPATSSLSVAWTGGAAEECEFAFWEVQGRPAGAVWVSSQGCQSLQSRDITQCTATGLTSATSYEFRIRERCVENSTDSPWSTVAQGTTDEMGAGAPATVTAQDATESSMLVEWSQPSLNDCRFQAYELQWQTTDASSTWTSVASCGGAQAYCDSSCFVSGLPSASPVRFRAKVSCQSATLDGPWTTSSAVFTLPRRAERMEAPNATVLGVDQVTLSWPVPPSPGSLTLNDCVLQGWQVEIFDYASGLWSRPGNGSCPNALSNAASQGCLVMGLACGSSYQARVAPVCNDIAAQPVDTGNATAFTMDRGAACHIRAGRPAGVVVLATSVSGVRISWEAGDSNDCSFASWDVHLRTASDALVAAAGCTGLARETTTCNAYGLAENTSYYATVQELCLEASASSPVAESLEPATTWSVPAPSISLTLPMAGSVVTSRPSEFTLMFDVDVELPQAGGAAVHPSWSVCSRSSEACHATCGNESSELEFSIRNHRIATWPLSTSFWQQGCIYDVSLTAGAVVTRLKPEKPSEEVAWSFTFQTTPAEFLQGVQVLSVATESVSFSVAWSASVDFRCRLLASGASLESSSQLASRGVPSGVVMEGLLPDARYDVECWATLQDEPEVASGWLAAGHIQSLPDLDVELSGLVLLVQPLCPTKTLEAYTLSVVPALAENRTNYTVALPNADFALNCSDEEASWQLRLEATPRSKYASASITWDDGTSQNDQNVALAVLKLPAEEVLTTMDLTVSVAAGCQCEFRTYSVQAMGLRLRFEMATPRVTKANGDEVGLDAVEDGHKMEVVVTYKSDALPAQLWNQLSLFVGPFQQVTVASPRPDLETEPLQQVYVMMTILSGAGKDLPLQLSIAGAQVGVASVQISFAPPFVTCLSAVGYGQCTTAEREQEQVFVSTVGETMLYAKGGFGGHESLASPGMLRLSVTQGGNTTELCEDSGWVSSTEMWCRLVPKGATPLVMYVLGPINQTELAEVPWSIRYQPPIIANFSEPVLQIMDGGQLYIIGQNFPDFPGEEASVGYEDAEAVRRLAGLPGAGFGTSEVCTNVVRVNQTHLLCEMKERIDLTAARCREVDLVVAWGDLRSQAQSVPILLPGPQIDTLEDMSPGLSVEVGSAILYQLRGVNFGTAGNGKIQVTMGDRPCNITSRNDGEIYCIVDGPLRDDLESLYPDPPINSSNGAVDVVVPIPVWLTLGSSSTSASEDCAPLAANWTSHAVHLLPCRAGQFRQNITNDNCTDCAPGWYTPVAGPFPTCLACVESSYAYQSGSTVCTECPAGRHTLEAASVSPLDCLCQPGFYLPAAQRQQEHQWRDEADRRRSFPILPCLPCPTGAVCAGDLSPPMSLPGWWVLPSEVPIPCTLAGCLGENQCDVGYNTRTRCETCTASYYIDLQESACAQCETWVQYFSLAYAAVFLVLLFCFLLPYLFFKARYALNPTKDVEPPWLCFGLCQCLLRRLWRKRLLHGAKGELVDIALKSEDHKVWSLARRFLGMFRGLHATPLRDLIQGAELLRVVNILLNNFQVCYMLANMSYKYWPEQAKVLLRSGMLFLNDVEQLRPDCVMQLTTTERWYLFFFLPYGLYVCALFFVLCHQRKHKARRMRITLMISGAFLLYLSPIHLLTAFKVFDCVLSGDGSWVLDLDRAVVCWEDPNWWSMFFVTAVDLSLLLILFLFLCLAVFHTYRWYRTAEVGMEPPRAVFLTWWWITGSRGVSLKHRAAICGHKVHLDLATDSLQASEINSLCDDLLDQNIGDLKSGIRRLWDYLQGFRIEHADDLSAEASNGELRPARPTSPRSGQTGPEGHHEEEPSRFSWSCCGRRVVIHKEQKLKARSDLRKAAYDRLTWRLEKLLVELRMMSSFSETQMNLADLLAFLWELVVLAHKTALGLIWVNTTHRPGLGLQLALAICASYFTLSLSVQPYRHRGLNVLESCFAFLNVLCVLMSMQMEYFGSNPTYENIVFALVFGYGTLGVVVLVMWTFFFAWEKTFQETYYVMMSGDFVGQGGQGDAEKPQVPGSQHELRNLPMLTRVVQSCEDLTEVEPCKARWCFHVKAPDALPTARAKHRATHERLDLSLEQAVAITVRHPKLLSRILDAEGSEVDFSACRDLGVPAGLAPGSLRRGGDLRGRIRVTVPCADQKLLRTTLRQLGAFRARCNDTKNDEDERSPRRISTVSSASAGVDTSYEAAQSTKSHVSTASRPSRVSRISATWPPPSAETAYTLEALPRPAKIAGRWVPAGAVLDVIRYVPPGASIDEAPVEFAETFLARLSRKRFGKGGVLRDSRGELILEFQRPNDPLDLHTELCELLLSRNEVPEDRREPTLDSPAHRAARIQEEHARSLLTQKAKALLKELGDFLLPLDLRFGLPTPSLSLQVSPRPDWGCMEEVLVLTRGCQQWIVQSMEIHHHLGLTSEFTVKLRRQTESLGFAPRHSVLQLMSSALAPLADESDSEDDPFEDEDAEPSLGKRTGKGSNSEGHFASRSAWRTKSGGVVFIHDFSCFGGQLELVGRPEDIKAVEKGRLLGQQVLWHPPRVATAEKALDKLWREGTDSTDCASDLRKDPLPVRGWFDGRTLTWEQRPMRQGIAERLKEGDDWFSSGTPAITQLPEGPWVRITSALEPEGIPGPDCGLWTYQASFYAECHGALPVQFLDRLGEYQAGPGSTELFLRSKRDAGPKAEAKPSGNMQQEVDFGDDWDSEDDEDFSLEILGLVDMPKKTDFQDLLPAPDVSALRRGPGPKA